MDAHYYENIDQATCASSTVIDDGSIIGSARTSPMDFVNDPSMGDDDYYPPDGAATLHAESDDPPPQPARLLPRESSARLKRRATMWVNTSKSTRMPRIRSPSSDSLFKLLFLVLLLVIVAMSTVQLAGNKASACQPLPPVIPAPVVEQPACTREDVVRNLGYCSGHGGYDVASGMCLCDLGWGGRNCDNTCSPERACNPPFGHCTDGETHGLCQCMLPYTGVNCTDLTGPCPTLAAWYAMPNDSRRPWAGVMGSQGDCTTCMFSPHVELPGCVLKNAVDQGSDGCLTFAVDEIVFLPGVDMFVGVGGNSLFAGPCGEMAYQDDIYTWLQDSARVPGQFAYETFTWEDTRLLSKHVSVHNATTALVFVRGRVWSTADSQHGFCVLLFAVNFATQRVERSIVYVDADVIVSGAAVLRSRVMLTTNIGLLSIDDDVRLLVREHVFIWHNGAFRIDTKVLGADANWQWVSRTEYNMSSTAGAEAESIRAEERLLLQSNGRLYLAADIDGMLCAIPWVWGDMASFARIGLMYTFRAPHLHATLVW